MKTLNLYVLKAFLTTFFMAILILTFAMLGGRIVQIVDKLAEGIPFESFLLFVICTLPVVLCYTIPLAVMVSVMLVFGRLSADSEITAMRACGISIVQIVSPILCVTLILSAVCLWLQMEIAPPCLWKARQEMKVALMEQPLVLFAPGRQIEYDRNKLIHIDNKIGDNELLGVQIYEVERTGDGSVEIRRDISAASGVLEIDEQNRMMNVILYDCTITDRSVGGRGTTVLADKIEMPVDYGRELNAMVLSQRPKFLKTKDLLGYIRLAKQTGQPTTGMEIELNIRIAFGLAPIAFLLFGLPLAIQSSRRETSVGLFLSVVLAGGFFLAVTICESFEDYHKLYPQYLIWLPILGYQIGGIFMMYRLTNK